jgi:hypothetical protein
MPGVQMWHEEMMIGRSDDLAKPVWVTGASTPRACLGLDRGTHLGQRHAPHQQAGHMTAHRTVIDSSPATPCTSGPSTHDPRDEARVGQKGGHTYVWAPVGSCPLMVRDNRHVSVHLFGAICPARGVGAAIVMPAVNTDAMNEHLAEISTRVAQGAHAVLILDGAGWHQKSGALRVPDNISLLCLPPYAPELNPRENVWE